MNKNEWNYNYWTIGVQDDFKREYVNDWNNYYTITKNTEYAPLVLQLKNKELARITENKNIVISGTQKEFDELGAAAPELKHYTILFKQILKLQGRK